jgi:hypothetical protein
MEVMKLEPNDDDAITTSSVCVISHEKHNAVKSEDQVS